MPSTMGKDTAVSILSKYLNPSEYIRDKHRNPAVWNWLENRTVLQKESKNISRMYQNVIMLRHHDFKDSRGKFLELYVVPQ